MKIGDIWVKLGLKKDEFSRGIKEAGNETRSFADVVKGIGTAAKGAFGFAVIAAGALAKTIKDLSTQSQALGDSVERFTAGMSAMFDTLKTSIASLDFGNVITNLREANRYARDLYDAVDAIGEISTGYNIANARQQKHINDLRLKLQDVTISDKERLNAGKELLEIYQKLEQNPTRGFKNIQDKTLDYYMQRMGVTLEGKTEDQLSKMRKKYVSFFEFLATEEGEAYLAAAERVNKNGGLNSKLGQTMIGNAAYKGMAEYARLAIMYSAKMSDEDRENVERAVVGYYQQEAKYSEETLRIQARISQIKKGGEKKEESKQTHIDSIDKIRANSYDPVKSIAENYRINLKEFRKYGQDTTALSDKFQRDLVKALSFDAKPDDLLESIMSDTERLKRHYDEILAIMEEFNIDSSKLKEKYNLLLVEADNNEIAELERENDAIDEINRSILEKFVEKYNVNVDRVGPDLRKMTDDALYSAQRMGQSMLLVKDIIEDLRDAVIGGFSDAVQELADQFAGLEDINPGRVFEALLTPLADMAIKEGEILMAQGVGVEACKKALDNLNGVPAIAAGAALIAIGAAAKSGLKALAGGAGATTATTYTGATSTAAQTQTIQTEMTITVQGRLRGSDIYLSGQKAVNSWSR